MILLMKFWHNDAFVISLLLYPEKSGCIDDLTNFQLRAPHLFQYFHFDIIFQ